MAASDGPPIGARPGHAQAELTRHTLCRMRLTEELEALAALHRSGELSDEQYERAKTQVIERGGGRAGDEVPSVIRVEPTSGVPSTPTSSGAPTVKAPVSRWTNLRTSAELLLIIAAALAFLSSIALTAAVPPLAKVAAPVLCRAPYSHDVVPTHTYNPEPGKTVRTLELVCEDAAGDVHRPGVLLTIVVLFLEETVLWFFVLVAGFLVWSGVSRLRGETGAVAAEP